MHLFALNRGSVWGGARSGPVAKAKLTSEAKLTSGVVCRGVVCPQMGTNYPIGRFLASTDGDKLPQRSLPRFLNILTIH